MKSKNIIDSKLNAFNSLLYPFLFTLTFILACKQDPSTVHATDRFINDHHSPRFKWGYIDKKAELKINNRYDDARDFSNGLAAVNFRGKWGYINQSGKIIIDFQYKEAQAYDGAYMVVKNMDDSWSIIDYTDTAHFTFNCDRLYPVYNDVCIFQTAGLYGWLNIASGDIYEAKYNKFYPFQNGIALAKLGDDYFTVNEFNEETKLPYDRVFPSSDGVYRVKHEGKYGFMDTDASLILSPSYDFASDFHRDKAFVKSEGNAWTINKKGQIQKTFHGSKIDLHSPGYLLQSVDDNTAFLLDFEGNQITQEAYEMIYRPKEKYTAVMKNELWGFLDSNGNKITPIEYPLVWPFQESFARVVIAQSGIGFIDTTGRIVIDPYFIEVKDFHEGLARVQVYQ